MKTFFKEYIDMVIYTICGILIILGSYNILININHARFINNKIVVSEVDKDYKTFKENILKIENILEKSENNNLKGTLSILKRNGVYNLLPGDKLTNIDLYNLNMYFIDEIINNGWIASLKQIDKYNNDENNELVYLLINNSNYVNKELLNNSNFHYDVKNNDIRNQMEEEYNLILSNYKEFSSLVLRLCGEL